MAYKRYPRLDEGRQYSHGRPGDDGGGRGRDAYFPPRRYEEWAWALDFLPNGYMDDPRPKHLRDPIVQVIGEQHFSLLEVILDRKVAEEFKFEPGTRHFIGKGEQNIIGQRFRRLHHDKMSINSKADLPRILENIVHQDEARFVDFYNNSQPITNRMHQLELLPGIGKKTMWQILDARKMKPFENFEDLTNRASISKPGQLIVKRIMRELEGIGEKHLIFVRGFQ